MNTAFDKAYEAYVVRKQAERQAHLLRLRQELLASMSMAPIGRTMGAANRANSGATRQPQALGHA